MINSKRLVAMMKKWQKAAAIKRRRISLQRNNKGYFVVYTTDKRRFVVPLEYLNNNIIKELFRMSEEEFGLPGNGPITLPCDGIFMEYVVSSLRGCLSEDVEEALLMSMATGRCSTSFLHREQSNHQLLLQGF